jgi:hypothetical protein
MSMQQLSSIQKEGATYMDKKSHRSFLPLKRHSKESVKGNKNKEDEKGNGRKWKTPPQIHWKI